ncbi:hypothetical protein [Chitinophaga arvensicola]|uniref:Outer membrane protein beta-barrel domain-containing protein n=1 Tax=Chitinophaga arvensicola TaxID=29529 RepID=A0A1I0RG27_9BACT|nr:hypothetical protein [Chitinophaga arvensicola]SEW39792.1 hypothetical protein SAMN04488122_2784 [Chitinophaga arvensicola]
MKKYIGLFLLCLPLVTLGQREKLLYGYAYGMIHDGNAGGGVIANVELLNHFISVGPGVEVTSYNDHTLIPVFADVKIKHRFLHIDPYITGQFGRNGYNVDRTAPVSNGTGQEMITFNESGKYFYGVGAGVAWHFSKIGVFASYIYRGYQYRYPDSVDADTHVVNFGDRAVNASVFNIGIVF